ncbi:DUF2141 domain-containing protein [Hymenobacter terrestris]|uniref:DUF2141 domain-containing protein n=1 Tax=Hymenobacter terrestris TaxID=2748310 RepID=A0ABX2Q6Z7_9BACT|nr:DUF2141 domain-containing protein [Hymenobacter terrestris]NVO86653.1 DUF2141 domain-containing protein [Hymenobacter terrestris]
MLRHPTSLFILLLLATVLVASKPLVQQAPLQIQILNVEKNNGKLVVEIYNAKAEWLKKPFRRVTLAPDDNTKKAVFAVPYGKYAVSIYQDTNENGELGMNFLQIPKEPIGFGNNYKPFGEPRFESALIDYGPAAQPVAIKLYSVF